MVRKEALDKFQKEIESIINQKKLQFEERFQENQVEWCKQFSIDLLKSCEEIVRLQQQDQLGEIEYIQIVFLRIHLLENRPYLPILVANEKWWLDEQIQEVGQYHCPLVFQIFSDLLQEAEPLRKKYIQKILPIDAWHIIQESSFDFMFYLERIAKKSIEDIVQTEIFKQIQFGKQMKLYMGEYMNENHLIYQIHLKSRSEKEHEILLEKIRERKEEELCLQNLSQLTLNDMDLKGSDFRFSDLSYNQMNQTDLRYSLLIGAIFKHCQLNKTNFQYCLLNEADFSYSQMNDVHFVGSEANIGLQNEKVWELPGYFPIRFTYASLKRADFRNCKLKGAIFCYADLEEADFRGSQLEGADFSFANMKNAKFFSKQCAELKLSSEQRDQIQIDDSYEAAYDFLWE